MKSIYWPLEDENVELRLKPKVDKSRWVNEEGESS